jgi:uncharacterized membrane protein
VLGFIRLAGALLRAARQRYQLSECGLLEQLNDMQTIMVVLWLLCLPMIMVCIDIALETFIRMTAQIHVEASRHAQL